MYNSPKDFPRGRNMSSLAPSARRAGSAADTDVMPCALVYIDETSAGSPNKRRHGALSYVEQAVTLNRSLLALGLPRLTVVSNVPRFIESYLDDLPADVRPTVQALIPSLSLSRNTRFYSAHFKLDLLEQVGSRVPEGSLLMLLDTDIFAFRPLSGDLLRRCAGTGVGAFDISDQEFSAYGSGRVVADLERVAGRRLRNPRWFGGECLLVTSSFIKELMPFARECFLRYVDALPQLIHQGDEMFMSAALNLLSENNRPIIDVGTYRLIGRHWSGNGHRDLRWFKGCSLVHLPDCKELLERQARARVLNADRLWRSIVLKHALNRLVWPIKQRRRQHYLERRMAVQPSI
ncbi:response regulator receiver protein [Paraburkholderia phymatum]|uniref:Uncharacterized protein n=1 Tax=Paraburkholderia phymatum (strain DSM 17167 / CIP 108236 / LMG 21445 / STM815) TaxID=391038 RepID=B2JRV4_PARP8|nr:hypothetical protein [Paraburkholderia phymatum]ACC73873.1 conserved hypothetical protein [Paraburkholderia phymatum STM815]